MTDAVDLEKEQRVSEVSRGAVQVDADRSIDVAEL